MPLISSKEFRTEKPVDPKLLEAIFNRLNPSLETQIFKRGFFILGADNVALFLVDKKQEDGGVPHLMSYWGALIRELGKNHWVVTEETSKGNGRFLRITEE